MKKFFAVLVLILLVSSAGFGALRAIQRAWRLEGVRTNDAARIARALKFGFPKDAVMEPGLPALAEAARLGHAAALTALLRAGADPKAKTTEAFASGPEKDAPVIPAGTSALGVTAFACARPGTDKAAELLLAAGADPNESADGVALAEIAVDSGEGASDPSACWAVARALINAGADMNSQAGEQRYVDAMAGSPLWVRLISAHVPVDLVELAVKQPGVDVNAQSAKGISGLMQAAVFGRADVAEVLLDAGADPDLAAPAGFTALIISKELKQKKVEQLLLSRGAAK